MCISAHLERYTSGMAGSLNSHFNLAPVGVYLANTSRCCRWSLTPPLHPCPQGGSETNLKRKRSVFAGRFEKLVLMPYVGGHHFCGTILTVTCTGRYPATCPVEPGLSSKIWNLLKVPHPRDYPDYFL